MLDDDALGKNPLEVELDSIWKVPKKGPVIHNALESVGDATATQSVMGDSAQRVQDVSGEEWIPLDNEPNFDRGVEEDLETGFDILSGDSGELSGEDDSSDYNVESVQLVGFRLGGELYGIDIMNIQEIIRNLDITRVPRAFDFVKGVVNLRGKVIPVISLKEKFNFGESSISKEKARIIIVSIDADNLLGFEVDEVTEVLRIKKDLIVPPPPSATRLDAQYITGVGRLDEQLIVILNLEQLIAKTSLTVDAT